MPRERLELSQGCPYGILSPACLPIPPPRHIHILVEIGVNFKIEFFSIASYHTDKWRWRIPPIDIPNREYKIEETLEDIFFLATRPKSG